MNETAEIEIVDIEDDAWAVEESGGHLWIGPPKNKHKIGDVVCDIEIGHLRASAEEKNRKRARLIAQAPAMQQEVIRLREEKGRLNEAIHDDVVSLLEALGKSTHARPESPRHVMLTEVIPAVRKQQERIEALEDVLGYAIKNCGDPTLAGELYSRVASVRQQAGGPQ